MNLLESAHLKRERKPIGWGNLIVQLNGIKYSNILLKWWQNEGKIIHGNIVANLHIEELNKAIEKAIHTHKLYDKKIYIHLSNGTVLVAGLLIIGTNIPIFSLLEPYQVKGYAIRHIFPSSKKKDKTPFKSLSSIIRVLEKHFNEELIRFEIKEFDEQIIEQEIINEP